MTEPVLVVETIPHVRAALMAVIEGDGYRTVGAASTSEALAKLRAGLRPCLILLDVGVRDVRWFRAEQLAEPRLAGLPIVVALDRGGSVDPSLAVTGTVGKPFVFARLAQIIGQHCLKNTN